MATTGAIIYIPFRAVSGRFTSNLTNTSTRNLKSWLGDQSVPWSDTQGRLTTNSRQLMLYLMNVVLGGPNFATLPDIADFVTTSQVNSIVNDAVIRGLSQQANANAQTLSAVVQVTVTAALPGAVQIPPVQLTNDSPGGE